MTKKCTQCGENIGGFMGSVEGDASAIQFCNDYGIKVPTPICRVCLIPLTREARAKKNGPGEEDEKQKAYAAAARIQICTLPTLPETPFQILGIASSHVALGTGVISQIFSSWTDFFGEQSETYNKKMREAEDACLTKLKIRAHEMGASAVIGVQTTYTELTSGHGMLMVCMTGTAVKVRENEP